MMSITKPLSHGAQAHEEGPTVGFDQVIDHADAVAARLAIARHGRAVFQRAYSMAPDDDPTDLG